jgi:hypothetical protein
VECGSKLQLTQDVARILDALKATTFHKHEANPCASTSGSNNYLKSLLIQMGTKCHVSNITEDRYFQV